MINRQTHTLSQDGDCRKTGTYDGERTTAEKNTKKTEAGREMEQTVNRDHPQRRRHYNKCNTEKGSMI